MNRSCTLIVLVAGTLISGCGDNSLPVLSSSSPEERVLEALEPYDPAYKIDHEGRVVELKLEGKHVTAAALDELSKFKELRSLSLYAASVQDDDLAKLQNIKTLESLGLGFTAITDDGLVHLEKLNRLRWVWLQMSGRQPLITRAGAEKLKEAIPGLTIYPQ
jgi:hypothetical protein